MKAKKSLGQNFLKSKQAIEKIVQTAAITPNDTVLEIGPGKGVLTDALLERAGRVVVIEKDTRMIPLLAERFKKELGTSKLILVHNDVIDINLQTIMAPFGTHDLPPLKLTSGNYKLIANIPYYITGEIIEQFLSGNNQPASMTLMVQKEVAERIVAKEGKESILSLSVKIYGEPKYVQTVSRRYFSPEPNVDSAILYISNISKNAFTDFSEKQFFDTIKLAFSQKRKMALKNLTKQFDRAKLQDIFNETQTPLEARAEDIHLDTWKEIVAALHI